MGDMNVVTNEQVKEALKNKKNKKIIKSFLRRFHSQFERDEMRSFAMEVVWRCLQQHNPKFKTQFTTSLYRMMYWKFCSELKRKKRKNPQFTILDRERLSIHSRIFEVCSTEEEPASLEEFFSYNEEYLSERVKYLNEEDKKILKQRFVEDLSYTRIGQLHGCCRQAAKNKVDKAVSNLRQICLRHD